MALEQRQPAGELKISVSHECTHQDDTKHNQAMSNRDCLCMVMARVIFPASMWEEHKEWLQRWSWIQTQPATAYAALPEGLEAPCKTILTDIIA